MCLCLRVRVKSRFNRKKTQRRRREKTHEAYFNRRYVIFFSSSSRVWLVYNSRKNPNPIHCVCVCAGASTAVYAMYFEYTYCYGAVIIHSTSQLTHSLIRSLPRVHRTFLIFLSIFCCCCCSLIIHIGPIFHHQL